MAGARAATDRRRALRDVVCGALAVALLYATLGLWVDAQFFHLRVVAWRVPWLVLAWLALWPCFYIIERIASERAAGVGRLLPMIGLWAILLGVFVLPDPGARADTALIGGVAGALALLTTAIDLRLRSPALQATLASGVLAWILVAAYPLLA